MNTAYFVYRPRTIAELRVPHFTHDEHPYEIVAEVALAAIDYENFTEDLLADRQFIEDHIHECGEQNGVYRCLFVHQRKKKEGILVLPQNDCFVKRAAYIV